MLNNNFQNIFIKFTLWLITGILIIIVGITDVFAYTYEDIGYFNSNSQVQVEVSYNDAPLTLNINNEYYLEDVYSLDINIVNLDLSQDYVYWFEIYLPQTNSIDANYAEVTWFGNNNTTGSCTILTTYFSNNYPHVTFKCNGSTNIRELAIRYYNTNNSYIINSNYFKWNYTYMRRRTPDNNDNTGNITDSIQQNTQDIINNQNQNTQDIINNQNQNTQAQIDSQKVCSVIDNSLIKTTNSYLSSNGSVVSNSGYGITDYISTSGSVFTPTSTFNSAYYCTYNSSKTLLQCYANNDLVLDQSLTLNSDVAYIRFTITKNSNKPTFKVCKNGNQALNDSLNDDDTSGASGEASEFFSSFSTNTFGLTSIITAPLNLIQSLTSSTCTQLHLPLPYLNNKYLDLPCMTTIYQTYFGAFFTMYQTITYGIIAYWVIVRIFNQVKDFKNPEHDEIEVVDL